MFTSDIILMLSDKLHCIVQAKQFNSSTLTLQVVIDRCACDIKPNTSVHCWFSSLSLVMLCMSFHHCSNILHLILCIGFFPFVLFFLLQFCVVVFQLCFVFFPSCFVLFCVFFPPYFVLLCFIYIYIYIYFLSSYVLCFVFCSAMFCVVFSAMFCVSFFQLFCVCFFQLCFVLFIFSHILFSVFFQPYFVFFPAMFCVFFVVFFPAVFFSAMFFLGPAMFCFVLQPCFVCTVYLHRQVSKDMMQTERLNDSIYAYLVSSVWSHGRQKTYNTHCYVLNTQTQCLL